MDYSIEVSSSKGKEKLKLTLTPMTSLEREFFNNLFVGGNAIIETIPNSDDILLTIKDKTAIPPQDDLI